MLQTVKSFIIEHKLFDKSDQMGLAISGGKDSVCMAHILQALEIPFVMIHINFQLRGDESDGDALFVQMLGAQLTYCKAVFTKVIDTQAYAAEHKVNTQLAARDIRYDYFEELRDKGIITKLITAHHQSDMVETFFINLQRQAGINGLKSIPIKRDFIVRPFLAVNSEAIVDYLEQNNIDYRSDSSNNSNKYTRNTWRNILLPQLKEHVPEIEQNVVSAIHQLQQENEVLSWLLKEKIDALATSIKNSLHIDSETLATYPQATVFLYRIVDKYGFNFAQCLQILDKNTKVGATFYSNSHQLLVDRKAFILEPITERTTHTLTVTGVGVYKLDGQELTVAEINQTEFNSNQKEETVSIPSSLFPLILRFWQEGDRIQPLGMTGSKLLSDFFIDQKINNSEKHTVPLLCKDSEVLWVCGHRISDKIKVRNDELVYKLTLA
ncbi:MAG: tRNA lysidine(34) synthetase TilS [Bacteroidetes bacterium]|nr:tRNA lysidine(34) synthetase TilS [Bacteroidota bacterium]